MNLRLRKTVTYITAFTFLQSAITPAMALPLAALRAAERPAVQTEGLSAEQGADVRLAFDGQADTAFSSLKKTVVEYPLASSQSLQSLRILDAAPFVLSAEYWNGRAWTTVPAWTGLDLTQQGEGWNGVELPRAIDTDRLRLTLEPRAGVSTGLKEIEFWTASGADALSAGVEATTQALTAAGTTPAPFRSYSASLAEGWIGAWPEQPSDNPADNQFTVALDLAPAAMKRAWLVYELYGVQDHAAVSRSINDQLAVGGYLIQKGTTWTQQKEAVNPAWLRSGDNHIRFTLPENAPYGYRVRNVKLVVEAHTGTQLLAALRSTGPAAAQIGRLFDAQTATAITLAQLQGAAVTPATVTPSNAAPAAPRGGRLGSLADRLESAQGVPSGTLSDGRVYTGVGSAAGKPAQAESAWTRTRHSSAELLPGCQDTYCQEVLPEGTVEASLEDWTALAQVSLFASGTGLANVEVQALAANGWISIGNAARLKTGWNTIGFAGQPAVKALRFRFDSLPAQLSLGELRLQGHAVQGTVARSLVLTSPLAGQYFGDKAYLKGFVSGQGAAAAQLMVGSQRLKTTQGEFEVMVRKPATVGPSWNVTVTAVYPDGQVMRQTVTLSSAQALDFERALSTPGNTQATPIDGGVPQVITADGASLEIDKGVIQNKTLSITPLRDVDLPALDAGMINVTRTHKGYRFLPHGRFAKQIKVRMGYDKAKLPAGYTEADIKTFFFDDATGRWVPLETADIDVAKGEVVALTDHFTDMINAVLQVPDNPETQSYTPTQLKDIKAADPGAGINLIEVPEASAMGDANLGYPIQLPPGRLGVQPNLRIGYSSGAGNGWLGLGWNLSLPSVGIDTRWGVPRYDAAKETETYTLSGEQLTPLAHREEPKPRSAEKVFHTRVEGAFQRIIRHGDSPKNYWWEVTSKDGSKFIYGGLNGQLSHNAVLTDGQGNVAHWALTEQRDSNGNFVRYHYAKVQDAGVGTGQGGVPGFQLYIQKITYTGSGGTEGLYTVDFQRDRDLGEARRADVSIDARLGFKQVTSDLLRKIQVKFKNQPVRSYELVYVSGAFAKTLLKEVKQFGADGSLFNTHRFDYFDEVRDANGNYHPYAGAEDWAVPSDGVVNSKVRTRGDLHNRASALSGTSTESNAGIHLTASVGIDDGNQCKSLTIGGAYDTGKSKSDGLLAMVDINGDGLPDKVMKSGSNLVFRLNKARPEGGSAAFHARKETLAGIHDFYKDKTSSRTVGLEGVLGCQNGTVSMNLNSGKSTTESPVFFTDANGDGLMDIASHGVVYFNHLGANDIPYFTSNSGDTLNPLGSSEPIDPTDLIVSNPQELAEALAQHPLHDLVRMWEAPFGGQVKVTAPVALIEDTSPERQEDAQADGVRVVIQHKATELWSARIAGNDYSEKTPTNVGAITVAKGDRLYFRVQSVVNGGWDQVRWNPEVEYVGSSGLSDANKKPHFHFTAADDFVLTAPAGQTLAMPLAGTLQLEGNFSKPVTSDDVRVKVLHNNQIVWQQNLPAAQVATATLSLPLAVNALDKLRFVVESDTTIDWPKLRWVPRLYYTASSDANLTIRDEDGKYILEFYPLPELTLYSGVVRPVTQAWVAPHIGGFTFRPELSFIDGAGADGEVVFSIKRNGQLLGKKVLTLVDGVIQNDPATNAIPVIGVTAQQGDLLWVEYHTHHNALRNRLLESRAARLMPAPLPPQVFDVGFYAGRDDAHFGPLYRGWGQFAYNGNGDRASAPINESELRVDDTPQPNVDFSGVTDEASLEAKFARDGYDPAKAKFIPLFADIRNQQWIGFDNLTWLKADSQSSSRMGADEFSEPSAVPFAGARAVTKLTKTTDKSFSVGGGYGPVSGSVSTTRSEIRSIVDFMDMNGDRYPDIVGSSQIQYTTMLGGLERSAIPNGLAEVRYSKAEATTGSLGGSVGEATPKKTGKIGGISIEMGSSAPPFGISGNYGISKDNEQYSWADINGDGLPDRVYNNGHAALNLGYRFAAAEPWQFAASKEGQSENTGANLGFNIGAMSIAGGLSLTKANNQVMRSLFDVNGDGLLDDVRVREGQPLRVALNNGNGFGPALDWTGVADLTKSSSTSMGGGLYVTFCYGPKIIPIKFCGNPGFNHHDGISREEQSLTDIDGDGFPDVLASNADNQLAVARSTIGRTNLLKKVTRPLGATIELDYARVGNTIPMPQSRWVMSKVEVADGVAGDGPATQLMTFKYEKGFYDRRERDFYGFEKVIAESRDTAAGNAVYRSVTRIFNNDNYYEKGLLLSETMTDAADQPFTRTANTYALKDVNTGTVLEFEAKRSTTATAFPQLVETKKTFFEGNDSQSKSTKTTYVYDDLGNVTHYADFGDVGTADDLIATISYHALPDPYVMSEPQSIVVKNAAGELLRRRESTLNAQGDLLELRRYLANGQPATHNFSYDAFGNVKTVQRPANASGQRYTLTYTYDADVNTHVAKVEDSFGYTSSADYDLRWGAVRESRDLNNQPIRTSFDPFGRIETITGPFEAGQGSKVTLRFDYHPEASIPWALTQHVDEGRADPLETVLFTDGLKRVLQTKKDGAVDADGDGTANDVMIVSGRVLFDAFGRTVAQYHPVTEGLGQQGVFNPAFDSVAPTLTAFDVLDREAQTTLPDGSLFRTVYDFGTDRDGVLQFRTTAIDANTLKKERFTDARGRQTALKEFNAGSTIWTSYRYNAINELVAVKDDRGNLTTAEYDLLGRRTALASPDAGREERVYDAASNMVQRITGNLREKGVAITYDYDFERLAATRYPLYPDNNVAYTYGAPGAPFNRVGRLEKVSDASGVEEFFYGPLGETVKTTRTVISLTGRGAKTYTTQFRYDTWNRLREMAYPDGEVLTYGYNAGGLLQSIQGKKGGDVYPYLTNLSYDSFEQRVFQAFGNGTTMRYAYEPKRRRLTNLQSANRNRTFADLHYAYDKMTNILELKNVAPVGTQPDGFGGPTRQEFGYDDLYRLTTANGHWANVQGHEERYDLDLAYDTIHNIVSKTQLHERLPSGEGKWLTQKKTSYDWTYKYESAKPHAATTIGERRFGYDANGNQLGWTQTGNGQRRGIVWDEENRIRTLSDNGRTQSYIYDADGERVIKRGRQGETAYINGYFVVRNGAVASKHVFNGTQRIATKLVMQESTTIPDPNGNGGSDNNGVGNGNLPPGWIKHGKTSNPGANFPSAEDRAQQLQSAAPYAPGTIIYEHQQYFYHPDHVGSTGFVTDANGQVYEHLEYFAFGETWVQERSNIERTPYLFTGKELDEETQLYYFGARYYDPRTSVWQSPDPILNDYFNGRVNGVYEPTNLALYSYARNNPVVLWDADGNIVPLIIGAIILADKAIAVYDTYQTAKSVASGQTSLEDLAKNKAGDMLARKVMPGGSIVGKIIDKVKDKKVVAKSTTVAEASTKKVTSKDVRGGDFEKSKKKALQENDGMCEYCQERAATQGDHLEPAVDFADRVNKGEMTLEEAKRVANSEENIVGSCGGTGGCNQSKGGRRPSRTPGPGRWVPPNPTQKILEIMDRLDSKSE